MKANENKKNLISILSKNDFLTHIDVYLKRWDLGTNEMLDIDFLGLILR